MLHPQITNHENAAKQNSCHSMTRGGMPLFHAFPYPPVYSSFVCGGVFLKECFMLNEESAYNEQHQTD